MLRRKDPPGGSKNTMSGLPALLASTDQSLGYFRLTPEGSLNGVKPAAAAPVVEVLPVVAVLPDVVDVVGFGPVSGVFLALPLMRMPTREASRERSASGKGEPDEVS